MLAGFSPGVRELRKVFLPPATKLGQGYVFTGVCDFVHRLGVPDQVPPRPGTPPRDQVHPPEPGTLPRPWRYGLRAGGTHPTGMHSCFFQFFYPKLHDNGRKRPREGTLPWQTPWICQWLPEFKT